VEIKLPMGVEFARRNSARRQFIPVKIRQGEIFPLEYHGSGHIHALVEADGMISLPQGVLTLLKGEPTDVRLF
jgi:molybdopterin biosynthesis enzyme